jgi:hypothetical protein
MVFVPLATIPVFQISNSGSWVLDRLLDELLLFTSIDGTLTTKSDDLSLHLGATSVVSVRMNAEAVMDGVPVTATLPCTRIWHKRPTAGGWSRVM